MFNGRQFKDLFVNKPKMYIRLQFAILQGCECNLLYLQMLIRLDHQLITGVLLDNMHLYGELNELEIKKK